MSSSNIFNFLFASEKTENVPVFPDSSLSLSITSDYGYVLLVSGLFFFTNLFLGAAVMQYRKKYFTAEKLQGFAEEHKKAFGYDAKTSVTFGMYCRYVDIFVLIIFYVCLSFYVYICMYVCIISHSILS